MSIKLAAIEAVQALPDIHEDLLFEAFDFLEKRKHAKMFIAINENLRSKWLRRKLWQEPSEIFVIAMDGNTISLSVSTFITIDELKVKLYEKKGYFPTKVILIYAGKLLEDGRSLSDYNIRDGCAIHAVLRLCGC
ncbi:hypothetical protein IC575_015092 [Cucumis melo]